jgi:hypothetical protein
MGKADCVSQGGQQVHVSWITMQQLDVEDSNTHYSPTACMGFPSSCVSAW